MTSPASGEKCDGRRRSTLQIRLCVSFCDSAWQARLSGLWERIEIKRDLLRKVDLHARIRKSERPAPRDQRNVHAEHRESSQVEGSPGFRNRLYAYKAEPS